MSNKIVLRLSECQLIVNCVLLRARVRETERKTQCVCCVRAKVRANKNVVNNATHTRYGESQIDNTMLSRSIVYHLKIETNVRITATMVEYICI